MAQGSARLHCGDLLSDLTALPYYRVLHSSQVFEAVFLTWTRATAMVVTVLTTEFHDLNSNLSAPSLGAFPLGPFPVDKEDINARAVSNIKRGTHSSG